MIFPECAIFIMEVLYNAILIEYAIFKYIVKVTSYSTRKLVIVVELTCKTVGDRKMLIKVKEELFLKK